MTELTISQTSDRDIAPPCVLIVEDDDKLAGIVARALEHAHLASRRTATGDGALAAVRTEPHPAALILDIMIPHPDGIEVCRQLRRDGWPGPIVAVSALDGPDQRARVRRAGADAFLAKPFHLSELVETVCALVVSPAPRPPGPPPGHGRQPAPRRRSTR